ncbi:MAG: thioredoxin-disulfide reductase [Erysipelotrichaceae bacterium]|nr:thioredoxin-disulfide reductase [Erysipelotrichaceae bacterium]
MDQRYELVIIGGGPAGMTAAVYASRAGLKTLVLEASAPGGKLVKTAEIANWPGITGINGADLAMKMYEHSISFGADMDFKDVIQVQPDGSDISVVCHDASTYHTKAVILATGTKERLLNIPNEAKLTGKGVSYCAVCDGAFFKDKTVTVIGGGNSALEESLYLSNFAQKIYIVIRRDQFRADKIAQEQVLANAKIDIIYKHVPVNIIEKDGRVGAIELEDVESKVHRILSTDGIFPYIGADPNTMMVKDLGITDHEGYLVVDDHMMTKTTGIFGAGDVNAKYLRQVVTATSDGAIAAQAAFHYIRK